MNAATAPRPLTPVTKISDQKLAEQRAHEPSMEEILASIRRIIADDTAFPLAPKIVAPAPPPAIANVPAPAPLHEAQAPARQILPQPAPAEATDPPVLTAPASVPPVETFVAAAGPVALVPPTRDVPPPQEVQVTVAPQPVHKADDKPPASDVLDLAFPAEAATQGADTGQIAIQLPIHVPAAIPAEPAAVVPPAVEPMPEAVPQWALEQALASESAPEPEFFEAPPPPRPVQVARQNPAPQPAISEALTSPGTEAAVLSSFQTLATSMFLNNSAMVENLTREMLRPMLKTWLDDNLPVMVERLVRAEIERVARGGR